MVKIIFGFILGFFILYVSNVSAVFYVHDCQKLTQENVIYVLNGNINDNSTGNCFNISANNIKFDCADNTIHLTKNGSMVFVANGVKT